MSRLVLGLLAMLCVAPAVAEPLSRFRSVRVARVTTAAEELVTIALEPDDELASTHETAGQYVQVRAARDIKPGFFALANAPGQPWELLVKRGGPLPDQLAALTSGALLEVTPAQGSGFPLAAHRGEDVVILAMGSGVSAARALLEHVLAHRADYGAVTLIAGGRTPAHLPYRDREASWTRAGARVIWTISRPDPSVPWAGATGYVQDHLTREMLTGRPTALFVVGSKEMMAGLSAKLQVIGAPDVKPLTNF